MSSSTTKTVFVNKSGHLVMLKVGNKQYFFSWANIKDGGEYKMHVNMNDMYMEFVVCLDDKSSNKEIVRSDDCCEFQCITIQEMAGGKLELLRQP